MYALHRVVARMNQAQGSRAPGARCWRESGCDGANRHAGMHSTCSHLTHGEHGRGAVGQEHVPQHHVFQRLAEDQLD
jgi:hypothetical protein